jgi:WD40 repeat protein
MRKIIVIASIFIAGASTAQPRSDIRWMRVGGPGPSDTFASLCASNAGNIYGTTYAGTWYFVSLLPGMMALEDPYSGFNAHAGLCSVLDRGDSELLSGLGSVDSWLPASNTFFPIFGGNAFNGSIYFMDATENGNLIAFYTDDDSLHLYNRITNQQVASWPNANGPVSFSPDGKLLLAAMNNNISLIDVQTHTILHSFPQLVNPLNHEPEDDVLFNPVQGGIFLVNDVGFGHLFEMDTSGQILDSLLNINLGIGVDGNEVSYSSDGSIIAAAGGGEIPLKS